MSRSRILSVIGIAALALTSAAQAADMPSIPMSAPVGTQVTEFFSAWYLRLDGGYRANSLSGGEILSIPSANITVPFYNTSVQDAWTVGGGVGYKWNWFRGDITFDYGNSPKFVGNTPAPSTVTAKLAAYTTLANAYIDLGSWFGFTPYLGAGVGTTYFKPSQFLLTSPVVPNGYLSTVGGDSRWTFSWAAMAGVSYALGPAFIFDVSYRYLNLGEARSTAVLPVPPAGEVNYGSLTAQEVRFGLRYLIP